MRELRIFELDEPGRPVSWRAREGQSVKAIEGRLWLTVEGHLADIWLLPGAVFALPAGTRVWLSGESEGARFTLAETPASAPLPWRWLGGLASALKRRFGERRASAAGQCPEPGL
ncbi:hypothetical protein OR16_23793 [Cupriavidus basilensis OR16]|uniref:DUF2917 domain-containing protein n=1 Tax=Cupriavidus basilensis OR16 TaxID=1127483 RepID=H1S9M4_9BURK|nr:DUF2917 domain-containing protein [Cupriavidus basilensis]EHP40800.1 hypothetical protein OR16_23793 [Cupriavidus basilensis OR16]